MSATPAPQSGGDPLPDQLGGSFSNPFAPPLIAGPLPNRIVEVNLNFPWLTWQERFLVGIPQQLQQPAPVLVLFHGYGEEPEHVVGNTPLVRAAMNRGWLVVIPLGAHKYNYGIDYSQENVEAALGVVARAIPIDVDRCYAVGFSMGGGHAASFAARHQDPTRFRFAAVVNHTGTASLGHTYHHSNDTNLFRSPLMFGGSPSEVPFAYERASTIDLDPFTGAIGTENDMARNLAHIPVHHWWATYDPNAYIVEETEALHAQLVTRGASSETIKTPTSVHDWSTLDAQAVLDWLAPITLEDPRPGDVVRTLADRDGRWFHFDVEQAEGEKFTPFLWSAQTATNRLFIIDAANLASIGFDVSTAGLDPDRPIGVVLNTTDGSNPDVVVRGLNTRPTNVRRNGVATAAWSWDDAARTMTLHEGSASGWGGWDIQP